MTMSPTVVCNNVLKRAFEENRDVTPMKLQKLLYFISCEYIKKTGKPLFSEKFGVWQYGPVLRSVYDEFKSYRAAPIDSYAKDAKGEAFAIDEDTAPNLKDSISFVWSKFKYESGSALSRITHREDSAWYRAFQEGLPEIEHSYLQEDASYGC